MNVQKNNVTSFLGLNFNGKILLLPLASPAFFCVSKYSVETATKCDPYEIQNWKKKLKSVSKVKIVKRVFFPLLNFPILYFYFATKKVHKANINKKLHQKEPWLIFQCKFNYSPKENLIRVRIMKLNDCIKKPSFKFLIWDYS